MLAVAPIVNDPLKVPVICPATDATDITENEAQKQGRDNYMFRVGMYGTGQANFMVDSMVKKFGYKKVGSADLDRGLGRHRAQGAAAPAQGERPEPVADETFDNNDTDMTPQIIKLKNAGAESILNYGWFARTRSWCRPRRSSGTIPRTCRLGASPARPSGRRPAPPPRACSPARRSPSTARSRRTARRSSTRTASATTRTWTPRCSPSDAYDCVYLFKIAMERDGIDAKAVRAGLENIPEFKGLVKHFKRPVFTKDRHNAVTEEDMS